MLEVNYDGARVDRWEQTINLHVLIAPLEPWEQDPDAWKDE
jgi:hypothetical protein